MRLAADDAIAEPIDEFDRIGADDDDEFLQYPGIDGAAAPVVLPSSWSISL